MQVVTETPRGDFAGERASFNLETVKAQIEKAMAAKTGQ
jgi:hypothetical protein